VDDRVRRALVEGRTIDITTTGRTSGAPRRIEIWFHNLDGTVYITGTPGKRDWYANLLAHPQFRFHLKEGVVADLAARARPITDAAARRAILTRVVERVGAAADLEAWLADSPLVEVAFEDG
jgi:deazaflavin-dependent oxidoreductase (nitroreductase family)